MSWQTWAAIVLLIIAALFALAWIFISDDARDVARAGGIGFAALALIVLATGMFTIVGTRQIGIVTTFGKPTGASLSNGLHFKAPWANVNEMDGAIQIDQFKGDDRILVRLGNSSTAKADASIRWQIHPSAAPELFVQYKHFDNVKSNLVTRNLQVALNEVFASFDPLAPQNLDTSPLPALSGKAAEILRQKVGTEVDVLDVSVPTIAYDDATEGKINQLNAERANTAVALQAQKTAAAQAEANRQLSSSVSNDPNVVVANCINATVGKGISPLGCWPGTGAMPTVPAR